MTGGAMSIDSGGVKKRRAVIALLEREGKLLVIKRSAKVVAPGRICFPGGSVEAGETLEEALVREMKEELSLRIDPQREVWQSCAPWGVDLHWWQVTCADPQRMICNPQEVAWARWMSWADLREVKNLLQSNLEFLEAHQEGLITI